MGVRLFIVLLCLFKVSVCCMASGDSVVPDPLHCETITSNVLSRDEMIHYVQSVLFPGLWPDNETDHVPVSATAGS